MRRSNWTPSIVPRGDDQNVYLVADDPGPTGRIWSEADFERTLEAVVLDLLEGQYKNPIRVVSFNTAEHCSISRTPPAVTLRRSHAGRYSLGVVCGYERPATTGRR
jgi:hypothetical protein